MDEAGLPREASVRKKNVAGYVRYESREGGIQGKLGPWLSQGEDAESRQRTISIAVVSYFCLLGLGLVHIVRDSAGSIPLDTQHLECISSPEKGTADLRDLAQSLALNAIM